MAKLCIELGLPPEIFLKTFFTTMSCKGAMLAYSDAAVYARLEWNNHMINWSRFPAKYTVMRLWNLSIVTQTAELEGTINIKWVLMAKLCIELGLPPEIFLKTFFTTMSCKGAMLAYSDAAVYARLEWNNHMINWSRFPAKYTVMRLCLEQQSLSKTSFWVEFALLENFGVTSPIPSMALPSKVLPSHQIFNPFALLFYYQSDQKSILKAFSNSC